MSTGTDVATLEANVTAAEKLRSNTARMVREARGEVQAALAAAIGCEAKDLERLIDRRVKAAEQLGRALLLEEAVSGRCVRARAALGRHWQAIRDAAALSEAKRPKPSPITWDVRSEPL